MKKVEYTVLIVTIKFKFVVLLKTFDKLPKIFGRSNERDYI